MGKQENMNSKQMPDTPWHIGYAKKEEDDPRRHKARCIYKKEHVCHCPSCVSYLFKCPGSTHCDYYAENLLQDELNHESHMSIEQEGKLRAEQYRRSKIKQAKELCQSDPLKYWDMGGKIRTRTCPICQETLQTKNDISICNYCRACFIFTNNNDLSAQGFLVKKEEKAHPCNDSSKKIYRFSGFPCVWEGKKCKNEKCNNYRLSCRDHQTCELYKPRTPNPRKK